MKKANHNGTDKEFLLEQERFVQTEVTKITFTLRKNGSHMPSGLGGRSFPVARQAGWQTDEILFNS